MTRMTAAISVVSILACANAAAAMPSVSFTPESVPIKVFADQTPQTSVSGQQTSVMTMITRPNGELVTAFPGRP